MVLTHLVIGSKQEERIHTWYIYTHTVDHGLDADSSQAILIANIVFAKKQYFL